jgi:phosphate starvation-inducible PhoH-like protein
VTGIAFHHFTDVDVVRHPLVQRIVVAYEKADALAQVAQDARETPRGSAPEADPQADPSSYVESAPATQPAPSGRSFRPDSD